MIDHVWLLEIFEDTEYRDYDGDNLTYWLTEVCFESRKAALRFARSHFPIRRICHTKGARTEIYLAITDEYEKYEYRIRPLRLRKYGE